jgi:hypothetical protein
MRQAVGFAVFQIFGCKPYNVSMSTPILATKLYIPPPRPKIVLRPCLIECLNEGLRQSPGFGRTPSVTLISAPASGRITDAPLPVAFM